MKRFAQIVGMLVLAWVIYNPVTHFLCLPRATRAPWVEPLATTGTHYRHLPELPAGGEDARKLYNGNDLEPVFKAGEQKRKLYAAFKSGTGKMGLLRRSSTVEGRPIVQWLLVQDGKVTYVQDSSRDGGAMPWTVYVRTRRDFKLGFMREGQFIEGEPSATDSPVVVFKIDYAYFF